MRSSLGRNTATSSAGSPIPSISRRGFLKTSIGAVVACALPGCGDDSPTETPSSNPRLTARPGDPTITPTTGVTALNLDGNRDGVLFVPESYSPDTPAPLFVALHGAGGRGDQWTADPDWAESRGIVLLAPDSRSNTWDVIQGLFGPDVDFIDRALQHTFDRCRIDPTRLALAGFSDGASYALSLGISNGDLFTHLIAYSPGFIASGPPVGKPKVFVSHGTADTILPVTLSRDSIVPTLRGADYDVTYEEFDGGHEIPSEIGDASLEWFLDVVPPA